jgi:antitoxin (DNA-binding transcriptional repressor) of toxin-antitoxin stability system
MSTNNLSYLIGIPNKGGMESFKDATQAVKSIWTEDMDRSVEDYVSRLAIGAPVVICRDGHRVATLVAIGSTTSTDPQSDISVMRGGDVNGG